MVLPGTGARAANGGSYARAEGCVPPERMYVDWMMAGGTVGWRDFRAEDVSVSDHRLHRATFRWRRVCRGPVPRWTHTTVAWPWPDGDTPGKCSRADDAARGSPRPHGPGSPPCWWSPPGAAAIPGRPARRARPPRRSRRGRPAHRPRSSARTVLWPAGAFCGGCGSSLGRRAGRGPARPERGQGVAGGQRGAAPRPRSCR